MAGHVTDHPILPGNVACVLDLGLQPLGQHGGDALTPADHPRQQRIADLGAAEQFFGNATLRGRGQPGCFHGSAQVSSAQMGLVQAAALRFQNALGVLVFCPAVILHQTILPANGGQPLIGVVLPQGQAVLAPAGHHAVGIHDTLCDKVIHQRAQIAGLTLQDELALPFCTAGGVQTGQQTLRSSFLVAGGAVELARAIQAPHHLALQRGFQAGRVYAVILDGVGRAHDFDVFKALNAPVKGVLHILRQAAGRTLQIHLLCVLAAGLHKDGVPVLARKAHHLVLNGGAVPGANPLDHAAIERAALDVVQNDPVGLGVGIGNPAFDLVVHGCIRQKAEGLQLAVRVAGLAFQLGEVDASPVDAGRGTGLEPPQRQTGGFQAFGQGIGGVHPIRTGSIPRITDKNFTTQIGARGNDHTLCAVLPVQLGHNALDMAVLHLNAHHLGLMDGKAGREFKGVLHIFVVALAVGLNAQGMNGRAFALVQHPALQVGGIRRKAHHTAQRIQFTHQRSFCSSADAGIAGHVANGIQAHGKHRRFGTQRSSSVGRFNASVARAYYDHIIIS